MHTSLHTSKDSLLNTYTTKFLLYVPFPVGRGKVGVLTEVGVIGIEPGYWADMRDCCCW